MTTGSPIEHREDCRAREAVVAHVHDGNVLVITLNRPAVKNAMNTDMSVGLRSAFQRLDHDPGLRVGVLTGAGETFCAGMDLKQYARSGKPQGAQLMLREGARKPLVAAVEGIALGGGFELALVADLIVAASDAQFGLPETRVGLFPSGGALYRLRGVLPTPLIAELAYTGGRLGADRAHQHGLVSRVTAPGETLAEALTVAADIARSAPLGVEACKDLLDRFPATTEDEFWLRQRELANAVQMSADAAEGTTAFAERRAPQWRGQ